MNIFALGDTLFIQGDRADNVVHLVREANEVRVSADDGRMQTFADIRAVFADLGAGHDRMTALIQPPTPISPNDPELPSFHLAVNLGAGDDMFTANLIPPPDPSLPQGGVLAIAVEGQAGNDDIFVQAGDANGATPFVLDELAIDVGGGQGSDEVGIIIINNRVGALSQKVNTGAGGDEVGIIIINSRVETLDQFVDLGAGDDLANLEARDLVVGETLAQKVHGGAGGDEVGIIIIGGRVETFDQFVDLGAGDDFANLEARDLVVGDTLAQKVKGGGGSDEVGIVIINNRVETLDQFLDLGAGDDFANLAARDLVVGGTLAQKVHGGAGGDEVGIIIINSRVETLDQFVDLGAGDDFANLEAHDLVVGGTLAQKVHGGAGDDEINAKMGFGPVPFMPTMVRCNLVMDGGAGDDLLDAQFSSAETQQKVAELHVALFGGGGDDLLRLLWTSDAFEALAFADGGAGCDTGLFSPGVRHVNVESVG